jgi:hypothetical protein
MRISNMQDQKLRQILPVVDPQTGKVISKAKRSDVHTKGLWHKALNAFIVRVRNGIVELLVQERSGLVDIAQHSYDQSLATQLLLEDADDYTAALARGLKEELNVDLGKVAKYIQFNREGNIRISKRYNYNSSLWNREIITSYFILLDSKVNLQLSSKTSSVKWVGVEDFINLMQINPSGFTKTPRIFYSSEEIRKQYYNVINVLVKGLDWKEIEGKYDFISDIDKDLLLEFSNDNTCKISLFDTTNIIDLIDLYRVKSEDFLDITENSVHQLLHKVNFKGSHQL